MENGLERGFVKHRLNYLLKTDPESLLMHSDNQCLTYFYIYVHLHKAKTATSTRLKASSDVVKC